MEISSAGAAATSRSNAALSQLTGNLDSFLTLLTTQLRNQDPLNPLDTEKFTSQLVQFAAVEQSVQTNKHLETLIGLQAAADREGALAMLGRTIMIESDKAANLGDGASWSYEIPNGAANVRLTVLNDKGQPVAQFAGDPRQGSHDVIWDGKLAGGGAAPNGVYTLQVQAKDAAGAAAPYTLLSRTSATSIGFGASGPQIETPIGPIALSAVKRVIGG